MAWFVSQCIALAVTVPILHVRAAEGASEPKVRPAAVAGSFYPADPQELSKMIDDLLANAAPPPVDGTIIAAVSPHAGYPYSGPVAAWTYAAIGAQVKAATSIARSGDRALALRGLRLHLGVRRRRLHHAARQVPVDKEFARRLAKMNSTIQLRTKAIRPLPMRRSILSRSSCRGCKRSWATLSWCPL